MVRGAIDDALSHRPQHLKDGDVAGGVGFDRTESCRAGCVVCGCAWLAIDSCLHATVVAGVIKV